MVNQFLYFTNKAKKPIGTTAQWRTLLKELGLLRVLGDTAPQSLEITKGPGDENGILFIGWPRSAPQKGRVAAFYKPEEQTWLKCDGGNFWIGYWNDKQPGPHDLTRNLRVATNAVTLSDGNEWHVPRARYPKSNTLLPMVLGIDENGDDIFTPEPQYERLCQLANDSWEQLFAERDDGVYRFHPDLHTDMALEALSLCYRVGKWEVRRALGLLSNTNIMELSGAILDLAAVNELFANSELSEAEQKKTDSGDSITPSGLMDETPTTAQPTASASCTE